MSRIQRVFEILRLLRARRVITAAELASSVGVSVRTIYRDVAELHDAGVPIQGEAGVGYWLKGAE
jgi:predicted DNA-binding transcriptional regulator YafY